MADPRAVDRRCRFLDLVRSRWWHEHALYEPAVATSALLELQEDACWRNLRGWGGGKVLSELSSPGTLTTRAADLQFLALLGEKGSPPNC